ncbi:MAG TPA: sulfatase [Blastocatellia bacterium]|nr:sulfatase [Blastocatellia bacterium]
MSKPVAGGLLVALMVAIAWPSRHAMVFAQRVQRGPNIIFIYADDMGYGDLGCYGAKSFKTPYLDRMAAEGLRLTSFYSVSPICTPSRAALMTGRYAARMGIEQMQLANVLFPTDKTGLPQSETTVARALKVRGYATACIGKWHLGSVSPHRATDHAFDYYFGIPYSNDMSPTPIMRNDLVVEEPAKQDTLTRRYTEEAIGFIERAKNRPFFLYLAHNMPHIPLHVSEKFRGKSAGGLYGDVIEELDSSVGEVLKAVKRLGLDRDTIVFFASDNGPWFQGSAGPLRGRKGWTFDGGVRVPGIVRWPGHIRAGRVSDEPVSTIDFFPTALGLAGEQNIAAASTEPLDGKSLVSFLAGEKAKAPDNLYLFFDGPYLQTARAGRWKIHVARWNIPRYTAASRQQKNVRLATPELYDMSVDVGESYDVAAAHPAVVSELRLRLTSVLKTFPKEIQDANADLLEAK